MPDTPPPPIPTVEPPTRPRSSSDGEGTGVRYSGLRLAGLLGAIVLLGLANLWMLIVVLAVFVMIFLHELGHYVMAKRAGMKVTEFFIGFGPKIWSTRRGETEYGIKVIPAGAYVKIPGMVNIDEVDPADEARTYRQKSFGQRIGVAVAGSAMHFALALVLIFTALVVVGQPQGSLTNGTGERPTVIDEVISGSGAAAAGLEPGDRITSVAGEPTPTSKELTAAVGPNKGTTVDVTVERDGDEVDLRVPLQAYTYVGDDGVAERNCGLGIVMAPAPNERVSPVAGVGQSVQEFGEILWVSVQGLGRFFSPSGIKDFASQVGSAQEDRESAGQLEPEDEATDPCAPTDGTTPVGGASGSGGGENRILSIYGLVRLGSDVGGVDPGALIGLFALINIFIGLFNLIPLLPFDGGHVAIACYERIQEKRLHRRRYMADVSRLLPLTYAVVVLLGMLFLSSLYLDVVNPLET